MFVLPCFIYVYCVYLILLRIIFCPNIIAAVRFDDTNIHSCFFLLSSPIIQSTRKMQQFTQLVLVSFGNWPGIKADTLCYLNCWVGSGSIQKLTSDYSIHYLLATLLNWFLIHSLIDQLLNQTLQVRYFTDLVLGSFGNWPVIKADYMCYLSCRVGFGNIQIITIDLII